MKGKKTGGRQKGTTNKRSKYDDYKNEIIKLIASNKSQSQIVREINKNNIEKISASRLSEYIKENDLIKEAEAYINNNKFNDVYAFKIKDKPNGNPITKLKSISKKYRSPYYLDEKTYIIYLEKYKIRFHSGIMTCPLYTFDEIESILEKYESSFTIDEVYSEIYEPIYNLIFSFSQKLMNQSMKKSNNSNISSTRVISIHEDNILKDFF